MTGGGGLPTPQALVWAPFGPPGAHRQTQEPSDCCSPQFHDLVLMTMAPAARR
jgi:hypothetical protein